jgi:hypothetical protein
MKGQKPKGGGKKTSIHQLAKTSFPPNFSNKTTVSDGGNPLVIPHIFFLCFFLYFVIL